MQQHTNKFVFLLQNVQPVTIWEDTEIKLPRCALREVICISLHEPLSNSESRVRRFYIFTFSSALPAFVEEASIWYSNSCAIIWKFQTLLLRFFRSVQLLQILRIYLKLLSQYLMPYSNRFSFSVGVSLYFNNANSGSSIPKLKRF